MPTFPTPTAIDATIDIATGHVRIVAADRTDTVVDVRPTDPADEDDVRAAEQATVEMANGRLVVKGPKSDAMRSRYGRRPPSIDVTVDLPTGSRLDADVWAEVRADGRLGDVAVHSAIGGIHLEEAGRLRLRTAAGDVTVTQTDGAADVTTSSGRVRIDSIVGNATVTSSNGDVTIGAVAGNARLRTAKGDILVERAEAAVAAKTAHGSIRIADVARGTVELTTAFGDLEVGVRAGTSAWLDVDSVAGRVHSELAGAGEPGPGDETVRVRARTSRGDILVRRADAVPAAG